MELNLWTDDFFLPQDVGLDLLADHRDGQYDDLKEQGRLAGDHKPGQIEDVVEQLSALSSQNSLDMNWMESDISSLLDALTSHPQQQELSFPELFDMTSSLPPDNVNQGHISILNDLLDSNMHLPGRDTTLTPPESPEQVHPVIKLEETGLRDDLTLRSDSPDYLITESNDIFHDGMDAISVAVPDEPVKSELQESLDFIDSPLSAAEVESMLSSPEPASPLSPNASTSNLILSSPELYKVIAAPSTISNRFSPYPKQKPEQKSKSPKSRAKKSKIDISEISEEVSPNLNKKDRKRLQNKNAAIRYRQKKKEETKHISSEVEDLEEKNEELKTKVEDLEREIRYMKNLMQDIQKAKGLTT